MPRKIAPINSDDARELSVLIIRVSAIGDVLMASPVAQAVKEAYPKARVTWIVEPLAASLVQANPYVDEVIILEAPSIVRAWKKKDFRELRRLFKHQIGLLKARHFDVAVDCQGLLKSGLISWYSGAQRRIGPIPGNEGSQLFANITSPWPKHPTRLAEKYLAMLEPLGIPLQPRQLVLEIPDMVHGEAKKFLDEQGMNGDPYVACCVSSSRAWKDWVWPRWGELADALWERHSLRTVFIGGPEKAQETEQLCADHASQPISAAGKTSLLQSAAIIQGSAGVVGVDTGLTYAGMSRRIPTVALYGPTDGSWLSDEPQTTICFHKKPCFPCKHHPTCANYDCMVAITVDEVVNALQTLRSSANPALVHG